MPCEIYWPSWVLGTVRYHLRELERLSDRWLGPDQPAGLRDHGAELQDELMALSERVPDLPPAFGAAIDAIEQEAVTLWERWTRWGA